MRCDLSLLKHGGFDRELVIPSQAVLALDSIRPCPMLTCRHWCRLQRRLAEEQALVICRMLPSARNLWRVLGMAISPMRVTGGIAAPMC